METYERFEYSHEGEMWIGIALRAYEKGAFKVYRIAADYRPKNPDKPTYYVLAKSRKEAKERFEKKISWLKIYDCAVVEGGDVVRILKDPARYLLSYRW